MWSNIKKQCSRKTNKKTAPSAANSIFVPFCSLKPIDTKADVTKCAFWEYEPDSLQGHWATHGCKTVHVNSNATTCSCNHLTHFAILMSSGRANVSDHPLKILIQQTCFPFFLHFYIKGRLWWSHLFSMRGRFERSIHLSVYTNY